MTQGRIMSTNQVNQNIYRFILLKGVLGWGVPTAIFFQLIMHFTGEADFSDGIISSLIIFPMTGILFGLVMWKYKQKKS